MQVTREDMEAAVKMVEAEFSFGGYSLDNPPPYMTVARGIILALTLREKQREQQQEQRVYFGPADMLCLALHYIRGLVKAGGIN